MRVVQLMASPFVGGPERQVLGLAEALRPQIETVFLSFAERGLARPFLDEANQGGFEAVELRENAPHIFRAAREVAWHFKRVGASVLCTNGYKPDLIGWLAARRAGLPIVAVSHGWTAATWKVRLNESVDRWVLRRVDRVVCVSEAQAVKVRAAGAPPERVRVIRNAVRADAFDRPDPSYRRALEGLFATPPAQIVASAGRLSPEKGPEVFVEAAAVIARKRSDTGFVLFGDGPLRDVVERRVAAYGLEKRFVLAGFRKDVHHFLPWCGLVVLSSWTEGLPVVVLEAMAAGVGVVATAVGGTPEVVADGTTGLLVPPGDAAALAQCIGELLADDARRRDMGRRGRERARTELTFDAQAIHYRELFKELGDAPNRGDAAGEVARALNGAAKGEPVLVADRGEAP